MQIEDFMCTVWHYYQSHGRHDLPWRLPEADGSFDPYKILVSEIMLQQTQVARVLQKYLAFIQEFPTVQALAAAPLGVVLVAWQGLGYNRRAKYLWQAAHTVVGEHNGVFPRMIQGLVRLPGVGVNTAGAVMAYAYDEPVAFVETNIRTVYIHHFFHEGTNIADKSILTLVMATLQAVGAGGDTASQKGATQQDIHYFAGAIRKTFGSPRGFYWALMDYGTYLKQSVGNKSRASKTYTKQSKFVGSLRQLRGEVLRTLVSGPLEEAILMDLLADERAPAVLTGLVQEGMVRQYDGLVELP